MSVDATVESVAAAFVSNLNIADAFAPNLLLDGSVVPAVADSRGYILQNATVGGDILGAIWRIAVSWPWPLVWLPT